MSRWALAPGADLADPALEGTGRSEEGRAPRIGDGPPVMRSVSFTGDAGLGRRG
ncbi:hypothetical protein GCM10009678_18890 [Actinomadura kijaniata]